MSGNHLFVFNLPYFEGIGNKTEISVRGQDRLIISTPNQRNEKATQNMSSPEATSGSAGGVVIGTQTHLRSWFCWMIMATVS